MTCRAVDVEVEKIKHGTYEKAIHMTIEMCIVCENTRGVFINRHG